MSDRILREVSVIPRSEALAIVAYLIHTLKPSVAEIAASTGSHHNTVRKCLQLKDAKESPPPTIRPMRKRAMDNAVRRETSGRKCTECPRRFLPQHREEGQCSSSCRESYRISLNRKVVL